MNLRRAQGHRLVAGFVLFMALQLSAGSPFFGVSVQGGFRTEADIGVAARAVGVVLQADRQSMATFASKLPLATREQNATAGAVLTLYDVLLTRFSRYTDRIGWAAANTTNTSTVVFQTLTEAYANATGALGTDFLAAITTVGAYAPAVGQILSDARNNMLTILADVNANLGQIQSAMGNFPSPPLTAKAIFAAVSKFQIASLVGALNALTDQVTVFNGNLQTVAATLTDADELMSAYVALLTQSFGTLDGRLTILSNRLTKAAADFNQKLSASVGTVSAGVRAFLDKIDKFRDDVIAPSAADIAAITNAFSNQYAATYAIVGPNVEERLALLVSNATDIVLAATQDLLFTVYRVVDGALARLPVAPAKGKSCAGSILRPFVQTLATNMASALGGCVFGTAGEAEDVLRNVQQQSLDALVKDRQAYFKLWNDALSGVSTSSDATVRRVAFAKLTAFQQTSGQSLDVLQPALASAFSMYAQLTSDLNAVLNRAQLCVTLKSAELSSQLVTTSVAYSTCLDS